MSAEKQDEKGPEQSTGPYVNDRLNLVRTELAAALGANNACTNIKIKSPILAFSALKIDYRSIGTAVHFTELMIAELFSVINACILIFFHE